MKYNNNILLRCVFFIVIQSHFNIQILETTNEVLYKCVSCTPVVDTRKCLML